MIVVPLLCPENVYENITYPATPAGNSTTVSCPEGSTGSMSRTCSATGEWETPTGPCGNIYIFALILRACWRHAMSCWRSTGFLLECY